MMKRFVRKMCMALAVCMLFTALPVLSLAQETAATAQVAGTVAPTPEKETEVYSGGAPNGTTEAAPTVAVGNPAATEAAEPAEGEEPAPDAAEPAEGEELAPEAAEPAEGEEPAPGATEPEEGEASTPETSEPAEGEEPAEGTEPAEGEPASIVSFELAEDGIAVPRGTAETDLGLPAELTATFSDGTSAPVAVTWVCVDDGQGGTAYKPENSTESVFTFRAVLEEDIPCDAELPTMGVAILDAPMPLTTVAKGDLTQYGLSIVGATSDASYEETGDAFGSIMCLYNGTYRAQSTTGPVRITVYSGATLIADEELNANVRVNGGTATLRGLTGKLAVDRGTATVTSGSVASLWISIGEVELQSGVTVTGEVEFVGNGSMTVNSATIGGQVTMYDGSLTANSATLNGNVDIESGSLTAEGTTFNNTINFRGGTCEITKGAIKELYIYSLPTDGKVDVTCDNITKLTIPPDILTEDILKPIVEDNWPADTVLKPDEKTTDIEVSIDEVKIGENLCIRCVGLLNVEYMPVESVVPGEGETIKYLTWAELKGGHVCSNVPNITRIVPMTLYLKSGTISKTYDGNGNFTGATVTNAVWQKSDGTEYDVGTSGCTVTVTGSVEDANAGTDKAVSNVQIVSVSGAPENTVLSTDMSEAQITATINKAEVSIIGTIYRNGQEDQLTWKEALRQPSVTITGLVEGETIENWNSVTLMSPPPSGSGEYINSLTGDFGDLPGLDVWEIALDAQNYAIKRPSLGYDYKLDVAYRTKKSNPTITMADWYKGPGELPFPTPVLNNPGPDGRSVEYQYRPADSTDETAWTTTQPTALGNYQIRAVLGAYNEYLPETTDPVPFSIEELLWSLSLQLSPNEIEFNDEVKCTIRLIASPEGAQYDPDFPTSGVMELYEDGELIPVQEPEFDASLGAYVDKLVSFLPDESPWKITAKYTKDGYEYTSNLEELLIKKKDISEKFYDEVRDGVYNGMSETGAMIHVGCDSQVLSLPNDVEVSITRNGKDWLFDDDEVSLRNEGCFFEPLQAGKYTMTVKVKESKDFYTGSYTSQEITVDKRWMKITMKAGTVEQGQPFTPEYEIDSRYPLADGDAIVLGPCYYKNDEKLTDTSKLEVNQEYPYALATKNIVAENGTDVTDSYMWVNDLSNAKVTVTAPKTEIAVSFAADDIVTHKTLTTTWTPNREDLSFDVYTEVGKAFAVICKTDDGYDELPELNDFADALTMNIIDEEGKPVRGFENAGTYRLVFSLKPGVSDRYALRLGDSDSPDTLTFTIPPLDLASEAVQIGEILPAIYDYETGEATEPYVTSVQVKNEDALLEEYEHYTIEYREDYNQPGDAYLWIIPCEGNANVTGEKKVKYTITAPTRFTITIPASVSLSDNAGSMTIGCKLQGSDAEVSVAVESQKNFCLVNESDSNKIVGYSLLRDGKSIEYDWRYEAAHFTKPANADPLEETKPTQELTFEVYNMPAPGNYSDRLTFTASVVN